MNTIPLDIEYTEFSVSKRVLNRAREAAFGVQATRLLPDGFRVNGEPTKVPRGVRLRFVNSDRAAAIDLDDGYLLERPLERVVADILLAFGVEPEKKEEVAGPAPEK